MADRETVKRILLSKTFRRTALGILIAVAVWFGYSSMEQASVADRCAESLASAVSQKDRAYLSKHVRNPSLEELLVHAAHAELAFVRPVDSEWSRIGLLIRASATATAATPIFILLSHQQSQQDCSFIQDYDAG